MSNHDPVVIIAAKRTAIGSFMGAFSNVPAVDLGAAVIKKIISETNISLNDIDEVIMGHVLTAGLGQNTARQTSIKAGIPKETTAYTINQVCGSGLKSIVLAAQSIMLGEANIIIAGGQENMSMSPHSTIMREGIKMGDTKLKDTMIIDGLWDAFNDYHMGITAENIAKQNNISRKRQDEFAVNSQQKTQKAISEGKFKDEIVPITNKSRKHEVVIDQDEFPKSGVTAETLSKLLPAFKQDGGTVTAGNSSGLNDGAAAVLLMRQSEANKRGLKPMAKISSWASSAVDPSIMGTAPIPATKKALEKSKWDVSDLDLVESNEAFAVQSCCVMDGLGLDSSKVNVNGGAISLGHPIGASGARIVVTLMHEMQKTDATKGLATLCIGGGMGIAMTFER